LLPLYASDLLQIIVLPTQLNPAAASTHNPPSIATLSGQHRASTSTSHDRLADDCHTFDCPTDDRLAVDPPMIASPRINSQSIAPPTILSSSPQMAPIKPTLALIEPTTALIVERHTVLLFCWQFVLLFVLQSLAFICQAEH
jgi:hypothetical protein